MKKIIIEGVVYGVRDSEVIVCGIGKGGCPADVYIEAEVHGKPVLQIRKGAFANSHIESVSIPSTVHSISGEAFMNCHNLRTVSEREVKTAQYVYAHGLNKVHPWVFIDGYSFANCENLTEINFKKPFRYVYESAFEGCKSLQILNAIIGQIRKNAFKGCSALEEISMGNDGHISNQSIEESAIRKIKTAQKLSYTQLIGKYMQTIPVKLCCDSYSDVANLAYMGFEVEII